MPSGMILLRRDRGLDAISITAKAVSYNLMILRRGRGLDAKSITAKAVSCDAMIWRDD